MRRRAPDRPLRVAHVVTVDLTSWLLLRAQLCRLQAEGFEVWTISAAGPYVPSLEALGIRHIVWRNATRGWSLASDLRAFVELFRIFRRERFDIVHTHNPKPGVLGRIAARLAGVPVVVNTVHGLYATPDDPILRKAGVLSLEWIAARFSDAELFQSEEDLTWAGRLRIARSPKAVLLGNGIDLERFDPAAVAPERLALLRSELGIPAGAMVVGTVGRLVLEKGYRELFEALAAVRDAYPQTKLLVVGGPDPDKWDSVPAELIERAGDNVVFAGHRDDVRDLLGLMDVFVLASWREGLPRSAVEAAAMGKALVLTDIRGCREVARDGAEGVLVPAKDAASLAGAIARLLGDEVARRRFGAAARTRAEERFDERHIEEVVVREYRRALADKGITTGGEGAFRFRPAGKADVPALARLHRETVPTAFLPTLGDRFVRLLYRALLRDPGGVAAVVEDRTGRVVAFASGAASVPSFYRRFFFRYGVPAALAAAPTLLRPRMLKRALETARYPKGAVGFPDAEVFVWAVDREVRMRGFGAAVLNEAMKELGRRGASEARIVVFAENERAGKVLRDAGWSVRGQINLHGAQVSNVWVAPCPSPLPSASRSA